MLPTIHPLSETPRGRGPDGECLCNWCHHWSPLLDHVRAQLDDRGRALLEEYVEHIEQRVEDGDTDRARLIGSWPGWEFMAALKDWNRETHVPVITFKAIEPGTEADVL